MLYPIENRVREVKNLNGLWNFKIDRENKGLDERWYERPLTETILMAVPASYNDLVTEKEDKEHVGYIWYERDFSVPESWDGKRIVLRFGSATQHAVCWVDGQEVVRHKGGYLPFEVDITQVLETISAETHRLTVAVSNILDWDCLPCGEIITKEGEGYPEGYHYQDTFFDFYNYAGLHRPVKLYTTPKHYISDIVIRTALNADMTVAEVSCDITGTDKLKRIQVIDEDGSVVAEKCFKTTTVADESGNDITLIVNEPHLWQPGNAYLYKLRVDGEEDAYTETFGIRSVEVTDKAFLINGKPFYFKGFGKHEDSNIHGKGLDEALNVKDFNLLKWMGANSFRTSHYPYSEELMMQADREGFVLIDEVPAVGMCFWDSRKAFDQVTEKTLAHHLDVLKDMYQRDKNHPCVVMWSVGNEADTSDERSVPYFKVVTDTMRSLDNTRPITLVQTREPHQDLTSQMVDVICVNRYNGWYEEHGHLEIISLHLEKELRTWYEKHHKPVIMTEYGAEAIAGLHKVPSVPFSEEYQCELLNEYHKAFDRHDFVVGEHPWAFADFQTKPLTMRIDGNKKGVFTRDRQPKMAVHMLRERWTKKA